MGSWRRVLLGSVIVLAGCSTADRPATPVDAASGSAPESAPTGCTARVEARPLPEWATAGFYGGTSVPHVLGGKGEIVAVLFGNPLSQNPDDGRNNKILWVSRPAPTPADPAAPATLVITATLDGTGTRVTREVAGGPGPSIIDMPRAGCWHLDLRWSGRSDTMDLVYVDR